MRVLDLSSATSLDDARSSQPSTPTAPPRFLPSIARVDLNVVRQHRTSSAELHGPAIAEVWDVRSGSLISSRELRGPVVDQSYDATGTYLIRTFADGTVRSWSPDGVPTELGTGYLSAVW